MDRVILRLLLEFASIACFSAAAACSVGCGNASLINAADSADDITPSGPASATPIQHIVIIMQENRSFDNLFNGFPGADTAQYGMHNGVRIPLRPTPLGHGGDLDHSHPGATVPLIGPDGTELSGVFPCFDYQTMGDLLDAQHITWRYYAPSQDSDQFFILSAYQAIRHIFFGPQWKHHIKSPETKVLADIEAGQLAQVTWIVPSFNNSDHPGAPPQGPDWVASIVNAIGKSKFWNSTAIFISWDDWGSWYDHVPRRRSTTWVWASACRSTLFRHTRNTAMFLTSHMNSAACCASLRMYIRSLRSIPETQ